MYDTYISFYLRMYRIHVFVEALRGIGCPRRICFLMSEDGRNLMIVPYKKKDLISHSVPGKVYDGRGGMGVNSYKLCQLIANRYKWDLAYSYRVPGMVFAEKRIAVFDLTRAEVIEH